MPKNRLLSLLVAVCPALGACEQAELPVEAGTGPEPALPEPAKALIPTVKIAPATGWPEGETPVPAPGLAVTAFATGLDHPRWLHVLPNGDVLVAETNGPAGRANLTGIKGWVTRQVMKRAGAGAPSADRITLLRDADGDGRAETRTAFLENLHSPFGMALVGGDLYVANTDALLRFPYEEGQTRIEAQGERIAGLPAGPVNHHWTKSLVASPDGSRLYVGVGSNSNVAERGMEVEQGRAAVWEIDPATRTHRLYATGLRNPVGIDFEPETGVLWTSVNERDLLGSDLVPDYMTSLEDGGFYGWPWSYFGGHVDERVKPARPDMVARALVPDYALGPHTSSLGLAFADPDTPLLPRFAEGAFVGQHGSWNRRPPSGYRVIFVPFENGRPAGPPLDVLTGFLDGEGNARGRPVGVVQDGSGALLVADDAGNTVWRVGAAR
ncbi:sorbosone dehydrogenase family protein [Geminicoccaceae bacterium 1502E]|nr:sorbosone dehydrogenase family protein [Geminicoccaceae bacterium 1502E]